MPPRSFKRSALIAGFAAIAIYGQRIANSEEPTVETALLGYRFSSSLVRSYELHFARTVKPQLKLVVDPKTNQRHYEPFDIGEPRVVKKFLEHQAMMRFDDSLPAGEKHFSELTDLQTGKVSHQLIWDGKTRVEFAFNTASINTGLPNGYTDGRFHYSHLYLNALGDTTFTKLFSSRTNVRHVGDADRDQGFVIETAPQDHSELANWGFRLRLNPHNGFLPTRIDRFFLNLDTLIDRIEITEFKLVAGGISVPIKAIVSRYDTGKDSNTFGQVADTTEIEIDVNRSTWNQKVEADRFERYEFPPGTYLIDHTIGDHDATK
jgi:hypothetical protein